jgi:hypothetical protein
MSRMPSLVITLCLLGQPPDKFDAVRAEYLADARKYSFHHDAERQHELKLVEKPVMRWATDDDWSGDVFVWTHAGRPEVIGCILSGPGTSGRPVYHEFHLLAEQPIAQVDLQTHRRWQPETGLPVSPIPEAPNPAESAAGRLVQMRQIARDFTANMEADGNWELRLLPQPLLRYGSETGELTDGALFTYVWSKGTDPEFVLLLECRRTGSGPAWHYAPVRFSTRELWLTHHDKEVWRVAAHQEPKTESAMIYSTAYARSMLLENNSAPAQDD